MADTLEQHASDAPDPPDGEGVGLSDLPVARPSEPARFRANTLYAVVSKDRAAQAVEALETAGADLSRVTLYASEDDAALLVPTPQRQGLLWYLGRLIWGDEIQFGTRYAEAVRDGDVVLRVRGGGRERKVAARALLAQGARLVNNFGRLTFRTLAP